MSMRERFTRGRFTRQRFTTAQPKAAQLVAAAALLVLLLAACAPKATTQGEQMGEMGTQAMTVDAAMMTLGAQVYADNCGGCHGPEGGGNVGPAHAGNANLARTDFVLNRILNGQGRMPAWRDRLSDEQIAAVATYIRNSWGNAFGPVTEAEVAAAR